ncbi:CS1 type fimbrial major subunit [Pseudomonas costantinii]|uniref:CS1 type fimbrial major subunit n=1 Tax=Pseudomonas costantinii TaxID=168469 RepID=A0A1S2V371_9PSED|nr:CS1 type fimbrial major subunit [Pseudomonas costantinii]OIN53167.1 hypothetical protein BFL40_12105 [Pseudomonas costantinii]SED20877.1 CS1 type fimbrial major subunit [Pseudomonas costantinii]
MIKRFLMAAPFAALVFSSSFAMAAETVTVQLRADIPSDDFYVRPVAGVDLSRVQSMNWNAASSRLETVNINLDMRNTAGGINARLDLAPELFSGSARIPLTVRIGNTAVTTNATSIAAATRVVAGARDTLTIAPTSNAVRPAAGNYTGTVSVIFEPAAPAA